MGLLLVDKTAMGSAATLTLREDLDLKGSEYSWAVSIYCELLCEHADRSLWSPSRHL